MLLIIIRAILKRTYNKRKRRVTSIPKGKTALAWLEDANISAEDKLVIQKMLLEKMDTSLKITQGPV